MPKTDLLVLVMVGGTATMGAMLVACGSDVTAAELIGPTADASADAGTLDGGGVSTGDGSSEGATGPRPPDKTGVTADGGIDPPNAGPGGDTATIACGATTCPIPAETCCVSEVGGSGNNAFACVASATCPTVPSGGETAALKCTGAANCGPGTVCCIRYNEPRAASECKASCGKNEAQLCDPKAADGGGCPAADPCSNDNIGDWGKLPDGFATCGGKGN